MFPAQQLQWMYFICLSLYDFVLFDMLDDILGLKLRIS